MITENWARFVLYQNMGSSVLEGWERARCLTKIILMARLLVGVCVLVRACYLRRLGLQHDSVSVKQGQVRAS